MNLSSGYESDRQSLANRSFHVEPFVPRRALTGAHTQTIASHLLPRPALRSAPERLLFDIEDGTKVLCLCHWQAKWQDALTIVVVHGLEGSSDSQYVIGTTAQAFDAGMNVVRMNVRNCGGTESMCSTLYHSGLSSDIAVVVRGLMERKGIERIALAGFSMGGNQVLKLAGEWGSGMYGGAPGALCAVAAVSPAMDLSISADAIHLRSNRIYEWRFLFSLRNRLKMKVRAFPEIFRVNKWWWRSIRDFDDCVTAPHFGFRDAEDYYTQESASRLLEHISVPTLILNSKDDPFIRVSGQSREKINANSSITYYETEHGGHCAFLAKPDDYGGRWAERQIIRFFQATAHHGNRR